MKNQNNTPIQETILYIPKSWESAMEKYKETALRLTKTPGKIQEVSWHKIDFNEKKMSLPKNLEINTVFDLGKYPEFSEFLLDEILRYLKFEEKNREKTISIFKKIIYKGDLSHEEINFINNIMTNQKNRFKEANKYVWGSYQKDLKSGGINIIGNENILWELKLAFENELNKRRK